MKFKKGDVVSLKSGGLKMTVKEFTAEGVRCIWSKKDNLIEENFEPSLLQRVQDVDKITVKFVGRKEEDI